MPVGNAALRIAWRDRLSPFKRLTTLATMIPKDAVRRPSSLARFRTSKLTIEGHRMRLFLSKNTGRISNNPVRITIFSPPELNPPLTGKVNRPISSTRTGPLFLICARSCPRPSVGAESAMEATAKLPMCPTNVAATQSKISPPSPRDRLQAGKTISEIASALTDPLPSPASGYWNPPTKNQSLTAVIILRSTAVS